MAELEAALRALSEETGWYCWRGVSGVVYARRLRTSPPRIVRAADVAALREKIKRAGDRTGGAPL